MTQQKTLQDLNLADDFLFSNVMTDTVLCRMFLEKLLKIKIRKISQPNSQRTVNPLFDSKGVRFDIYTDDDENRVYEIEIQSYTQTHVPKRSRYYQSIMDMDCLTKGNPYDKLPHSFVIFICTWDPFDAGRHLYTFENICKEDNGIAFGDDSTKIVLNTQGTLDDVDEEIKLFLKYVENSDVSVLSNHKSPFLQMLHEKVTSVKANHLMEVKYMTLKEKMDLIRAEGKVEGKIETLCETITNMIAYGMDIKQISEILHLSESEIERILA